MSSPTQPKEEVVVNQKEKTMEVRMESPATAEVTVQGSPAMVEPETAPPQSVQNEYVALVRLANVVKTT